jgi:hypothetical protein
MLIVFSPIIPIASGSLVYRGQYISFSSGAPVTGLPRWLG